MALTHPNQLKTGTPLDACIAQQGDVSVARFMELALTHPEWGYYSTHPPLGKAGDFTTAPEISQIFGELLGLWCVDVWHKLGAPQAFTLLDLGGGHGSLMADMLRAGDTQSGFRDARQAVIVDHSPLLRAQQKQRVPQANVLSSLEALADLPKQPCLVIANEFFDALPIQQFCWQDNTWQERVVTWHHGALQFRTKTCTMPAACVYPAHVPKDGDILEYSARAHKLVQMLGAHIMRYGGAILIIDFGSIAPRYGDSLQAVQAHSACSLLEHAGQCDISAHVNFAALAKYARHMGCAVSGATTQRQFLRALGADMRAAALVKARPEMENEVYAGLARLLHPDAMGVLFKVIALHLPGLAVEGFM